MTFEFKTYRIQDLINWIDKASIDLKPYYQRNDIWTKADQQSLIETILKGYPIPNFFIYRNKDESEMVDGQQRARAIHRFVKRTILTVNGESIGEIDVFKFMNYELCVTVINNIKSRKEIEEFYVLVNKKGKHLSTPELHKAEFADTTFLRLVEDLLDYQNFINLDLFTDAASRRMADRNYVEELVAYLISGIQDKKSIIEAIYEEDVDANHAKELTKSFKTIIDKIQLLNEVYPLTKTRYKQKNDFYTLFNFVHQNLGEDDEVLKAQYDFLLIIGPYISPSNNECEPLREYAINCVSQSNSRNAREERLKFFGQVLLNKSELEDNDVLAEVCRYVEWAEGKEIDLIKVGQYLLPRKK